MKVKLNAAVRLAAAVKVVAEIDYYKGIRAYVDDAMNRKLSSEELENLVYNQAKLKVPDLKPLSDWLMANEQHWTALEDAVGDGNHVVKGVTVPAAVYAAFAKLYDAIF